MYTIGQVAKFLGMSRDTLKFYEEMGLARPVQDQKIKVYDTILMVMPLYIHAMPSGVMALIEAMEEAENPQSTLGFMEQYPDEVEVLKKKLEGLGRQFEKTGQFDKEIMKALAMPYQMPKGMRTLLRIACKFGMVDRHWKKLLKENHALEHAKDQLFLKY